MLAFRLCQAIGEILQCRKSLVILHYETVKFQLKISQKTNKKMIAQNTPILLVQGEQLVSLIAEAVEKGLSKINGIQPNADKLYTINQVAKRFGRALKNLVKDGTIKTTKNGQISESALQAYLTNSNDN
jgi:hypothetical protein